MKRTLYIVMDLERIALVLRQMRHLIDLMLLDRNLIVDLIALEFERENGYRHPPLYIVTITQIIIHSGARRVAEKCMKNTHVQTLN
jgi:hypothetical protein